MKLPNLVSGYWFLSGITICHALTFAPTPTPEPWRPGMKCPTQIHGVIPGPPMPFGILKASTPRCSPVLASPIFILLAIRTRVRRPFPTQAIPSCYRLIQITTANATSPPPETLILHGYWSDETRTNFSVGTEFDAKWYPDWYAKYESELSYPTKSGTEGQSTSESTGEAGPEVQRVLHRAGPEIGSPVLKITTGTPFVIESFITERPMGTPTAPPRSTAQPLTNFDKWLQVMDFSRIHTLTLSGEKQPSLTMNVARKLPAHLKSLHTVDLKDSPISVVEAFLTGLPNNTLKSLT